MKQLFLLLVLSLFISCKQNEVKSSLEKTEVGSSHQELLDYEKKGYRILLNKKPIKIANMFLDRREISRIEIDEKQKLLTITRKDTILNLMNLLSIANNLELEKQLIIIDGYKFESKDFETVELEMSAMESVRVKRDTVANGKEYNKVYFLKTFNDATTANSRL
jgi:hypothetical protein